MNSQNFEPINFSSFYSPTVRGWNESSPTQIGVWQDGVWQDGVWQIVPCHLLPAPSQWQGQKSYSLRENKLHYLLTTLCLSFLICKTGLWVLPRGLEWELLELKHVKCLVQVLELRKCWSMISSYLVRYSQYCNVPKDFYKSFCPFLHTDGGEKLALLFLYPNFLPFLIRFVHLTTDISIIWPWWKESGVWKI